VVRAASDVLEADLLPGRDMDSNDLSRGRSRLPSDTSVSSARDDVLVELWSAGLGLLTPKTSLNELRDRSSLARTSTLDFDLPSSVPPTAIGGIEPESPSVLPAESTLK
jgi:hypothetical protein